MAEPASGEGAESEAGAAVSDIVPEATFIEDVAAYVQDRPADEVLAELRALHARYQVVEAEVARRRARMAAKEPEISRCAEAVELLRARRATAAGPLALDFSLSSHVYARARVPADTATVALWLGAGVMLEYGLDEAAALLEGQLEGCRSQLAAARADGEWVKDQLTTMEVSIARVYNHDVTARRRASAA